MRLIKHLCPCWMNRVSKYVARVFTITEGAQVTNGSDIIIAYTAKVVMSGCALLFLVLVEITTVVTVSVSEHREQRGQRLRKEAVSETTS